MATAGGTPTEDARRHSAPVTRKGPATAVVTPTMKRARLSENPLPSPRSHRAVRNADLTTVQLLDLGANINHMNFWSEKVLFTAIRNSRSSHIFVEQGGGGPPYP